MSYGTLHEVAYSPYDEADEPVSLAEAKAYLRLPELSPADTAEDDSIETMIASAREVAEQLNNRIFRRRRFVRTVDSFPCGPIYLHTPLVSVEQVRYRLRAGTWTDLVDGTNFVVETIQKPGFVMLPTDVSWPTAELWPASSVQVFFTAGIGADTYEPTLPNHIRQGILLLVSHWYSHRLPIEVGNTNLPTEVPFAATMLLERGAVPRVGW